MRGRRVKKSRDERKETGVDAKAEGWRDGDRWTERKGRDEEERRGREFKQTEMKIRAEIQSKRERKKKSCCSV